MSKKELAAKLINDARLHAPLSLLRSLLIPEVKILAYHRIVDISENNKYLYDRELISASASDFEWQMNYIKKNYEPISFTQFTEYLIGNTKLPKKAVLVTFDDGFNDNYHTAYPILKKLNVPATIFLSTGYIGGKETFWFDWLAHLLFVLPNGGLYIQQLDMKLNLSNSFSEREKIFLQLITKLKKVKNDIRLDVLNDLKRRYKSILEIETEQNKTYSLPMTWDQVLEMSKNGIEFGSHTVSHPILSSLTREQLFSELSESKEIIKKNIGKDIDVLAYPNGLINDFNEDVQIIAKELGYKVGLSYISGSNSLNKLDLFAMKRIAIETDTSRQLFLSKMLLPELF